MHPADWGGLCTWPTEGYVPARLGGMNLASGWSRPHLPLAAASPFMDLRPFAAERQSEPVVLAPHGDGFAGLPWGNGPTTRYLHRFTPLEDAEVLAEAGGRPVLVRRRWGSGRVVFFLAPPFGSDEDGRPYWTWRGWLPFVTAWLEHVTVR